MKIVNRKVNNKRVNVKNIPNIMTFSFIRNWLSDSKYEEDREQYFIGNLSGQQINLTMKEIKWLTKTFKELDIVTIEDRDGNITQISL
jgi:hypothetical protein